MAGHRLMVRNRGATSREIACYVRSLARRGGLSTSQAYRLRLATDEIVTNVVLHGYRGQAGPVEITGGVDATRVWLRIEDQAPPFDPRSHDPLPRLDQDMDDAEEGGFGLFLALRSVDDFRYERVGERNRNTLVVWRPGHRPGPGPRHGPIPEPDERRKP